MLSGFKRAVAAAAVAVAAGGLAVVAALPAGATTLTCTNVNGALLSPFGCGGLQSDSSVSNPLDLAHVTNAYNGLVTVQADANSPSEDWTAFAVTPPSILSTTSITGSVGDLGAYIAMDTPNGLIPRFTVVTPGTSGGPTDKCNTTNTAGTTYTNAYPCAGTVFTAGADDLCLSVEHASNVAGTNGKYRWWTVLRECNTNGAFKYGKPAGPGLPNGAPGLVMGGFANQYQEWAPINSGQSGFLMDNIWLFNHKNIDYLLNITGNGPANTAVQAYPDSGLPPLWEQWGIIGCTPPANLLAVQTYVSCP